MFSSPEELGKRILNMVNPTFRTHVTKIITVERNNVDMMWDDDIAISGINNGQNTTERNGEQTEQNGKQTDLKGEQAEQKDEQTEK